MIGRREFVGLSLAFLASPRLLAASGKVFQTNGIAVNGTDIVAYFTKGEPMAGSSEYAHQWMGVTWHFANPQHLEMFQKSPESYAPQFGGFCAYAAAKGSLAPSVPEAWTIYNDKLYLNFSLDVRKRWLKDPEGNIKKAEANWPNL